MINSASAGSKQAIDFARLERYWGNFKEESSTYISKHEQLTRKSAYDRLVKYLHEHEFENGRILKSVLDLKNSSKLIQPVSHDQDVFMNRKKSLLMNKNYMLVAPGYFYRNIDPVIENQGITIDNYLETEQNDWVLPPVDNTGQKKKHSGLVHKFADVFANSGVVIQIPKDTIVTQPLLCTIFIPGNTSTISKVIIHCEKGSEATIVLDCSNDPLKSQGSHIASMQLLIEEKSHVKLITLQDQSLQTVSFSSQTAFLDGNSKLDWTSIDIGSQKSHQEVQVFLNGDGCTTNQNGIFICGTGQEFNYDTEQIHFARATQSRFLYKGIQLGSGNSSWKGNIYVAKGADKTDSYQANGNLILSGNAKAVSIPGLEILSDDVKCSHGATVGNIDENELFYLLSRGIGKPDAVQLLALGYAEDVLKNLSELPFFDKLVDLINNKLRQEFESPVLSSARMNIEK